MDDRKRKNLIWYLEASALCAALSLVYGRFSHGIRSPWMSLLFLWPLLLGAVPAALDIFGLLPGSRPTEGRKRTPEKRRLERVGRRLHRFGIEAQICASLLNGIFEIAGTDSVYPDVLLGFGAALIAAGFILYVVSQIDKTERK